MVQVENIADWRGKELIDRFGDKIGKLEDVYVDTESDEPVFGSVKQGLLSKHLTFVPLVGATASPGGLRVDASKEEVKQAPNIDRGGELGPNQERALYNHYKLDYTPSTSSASGRRLAKR